MDETGLLTKVVRKGIQLEYRDEDLEKMMPDLPMTGTLGEYRRMASFNWREMKLIIEGEEVIRFRNRIFSILKSDPIFKREPDEEETRDEKREITFKRFKKLMEYNILPDEEFMANPLLTQTLYTTLGQYDWSLSTKKFLAYEFVTVSLRGAGSSRHLAILDQLLSFEALGCFSLTELAHGSNTKDMGTRAEFDAQTNEFILHTPTFESAKVWSGNMGQTATHAVLFAQLYVNHKHHGLGAFIVPIRDPKTLLPYEGVFVGDMGPKLGLNGLDNGYLMLKNYRVPKGNLMNRTGDVNSSGDYVSEIKDRKRRMGITLGTLSMGRVGIIPVSVANMQKALTIAIRYSAARRQFGPEPTQKELPVIEYQMQQWRLFPYLSASFVLDIFSQSLLRDFLNFQVGVLFGTSSPTLSELGQEIHSVACAAKPLTGWICRDAIQECREACGGHGFLKAAAFGELRDDHDANNTYEGDNNVLQMQTGNFLVRTFSKVLKVKRDTESGKEIEADEYGEVNSDGKIKSQLGSIDLINDVEENIKNRFKSQTMIEVLDFDVLLEAYRFLVSYLLVRTKKKFDIELRKHNRNVFTARTNTQVYFGRSLSFAYIENFILMRYKRFLDEELAPEVPESIRVVLKNMGLLYGFWSLDAHSSMLYEGGYFRGPKPSRLIRKAILHLCEQIKPDAVSLADVISPPDHILNSVLGQSDGEIYKNIFETITKYRSPDGDDRPSWYREFTENKPEIAHISPDHIKSKI